MLSLLIHILSVVKLGGGSRYRPRTTIAPSSQVKIRVVEKPKRRTKQPSKADPNAPLLEAPQKPTEAPQAPTHLGTTDHRAERETRLSNKPRRERAADAGTKGRPDTSQARATEAKPKPTPQTKSQDKPVEPKNVAQQQTLPTLQPQPGTLAVKSYQPKPRNAYEALLPTGPADLAGQFNAGFQDFVDERITEGDRIDINTTEYRYIGYFTSMRKAIELVWNYPLDAARRGEQGEVGLEFVIAQDGHVSQVKLLRSSGYALLDDAIIQAIKVASPFSPLPNGIGKNRLVVTGSFRYVLNGL